MNEFDHYAVANDLIERLESDGHGRDARTLRDAIERGATGTEIFMALQFHLREILTRRTLSEGIREIGTTLLSALDLALEPKVAPPQRDTCRHTYTDYLAWSEGIHHELIDGVPFMMAPAPVRVHQEVVGEMYRQVSNALEGKRCRAYVAPFDVRLPKGQEADCDIDTVVQPDVLIVCDRSKLDPRGMRGAPDWLADVLSPATASHDQTIKLAAYERAGVPEVWLVHPTERVVTVYRLEGTRYGRPAISEMTGSLAIGPVSGVAIDWNRLIEQLA